MFHGLTLEYEIAIYRWRRKVSNQFVKPNVSDIASVKKSQLKIVLVNPVSTGKTNRTKNSLFFTSI